MTFPGLAPHDEPDGLTILRNHVHHNGNHGIICSERCDHVHIRDNHSHHNLENGITLHRLVTDPEWTRPPVTS
ncbi:MAG: right-handed parallel beta-helix repeat-containing protein [Myxococcota bacterium]